jgi:SET domain-containing protein
MSDAAPLRTAAVVFRRHGSDHLGVAAERDFAAGQVVLALDGRIVARPTRYTVQVGDHEHVDAEARPERGDEFPLWRFLNHSCAPNTRIDGRTLVALTAIGAGEEITFDYDSTEWDMASPFACACGAPGCRGMVRGYRHLGPAQRALVLSPAPHLLAASARER